MQSIEQIRKRVLFYSIFANTLLGSVIAVVVIVPLIILLNSKNQKELDSLVRSRLVLAQQVTSRMGDVAKQITSRTRLRQKLEDYNHGRVGQRELAVFSAPLLKDAMNQSEAVIGITRFSGENQKVVHVGVEIPDAIVKKIDLKKRKLQFFHPLRIGPRYVIPVLAPILDRNGQSVGSDLVVFHAYPLQRVTTEYSGLGKTGQVLIGSFRNGVFQSFYVSRFGVGNHEIEFEQKMMREGVQNVSRDGYSSRIMRIQNTDWFVVLHIENSELRSLIKVVVFLVLVVVALIIAAGTILTAWMINPLMKRVVEDFKARLLIENELRVKRNELESLNRDLESRIKKAVEESRENEQMLVQQSKLASMGEMLGAIAHQWRQPLNTLSLYIQDTREAYDYGEMDQAYVHRFVEQSMKIIHFMSNTINEFRQFFRPSREKTDIPLVQAIEETIHIISGQLQNHNIQVQIHCADEQPCQSITIAGYLNEFKFVFLSILNNSREAINARRRAGNLHRTEAGMIDIDLERRDSGVEIRVRDNGTGIPEELRSRVFDAYFTTKEEERAVGIGLYMARKIIQDNLSGTIEARNDPKTNGALIRIFIPHSQEGSS